MNHPFIVGLNYAFQTESKLFLVMDYCPGGDLGKLLAKKKALKEEEVRLYISELILAFEALHKNMIVFRDLKPDNVVLDS
jgi:serine/threonine protein kinase